MGKIVRNLSRGVARLHRLRNPRAVYDYLYDIDPCRLPLARFPHLINIELTNDCNLGCPHCHRSVMRRPIGYMPPSLFEKIIIESAAYPRRTVKLAGLGEPALHPRLEAMLDFLSKREVTAFLYTNGRFLQRFSVPRIIDWDLDTIVVSIDGCDPRSYADRRPGGDYRAVRTAVGELHKALRNAPGCRTQIEIRHVRFAEESTDQLLRFQQDWLPLADRVRYCLHIPSRGAQYAGRFQRCRDIRLQLYVLWDGRVPLCGYQYLYDECRTLGNAHREDLRDLWRNPELRILRWHHRRRDSGSVDYCRFCTLTQQRRLAAVSWVLGEA